MIQVRPTYSPPAAPIDYLPKWVRDQLAAIARVIVPPTVRTVRAATTVEGTDDGGTILCDATAGAFAVTFPPANQLQFLRVSVKKIDASANAVTLAATIDNSVSPTLAARWNAMTVTCDGSAYYKLASV